MKVTMHGHGMGMDMSMGRSQQTIIHKPSKQQYKQTSAQASNFTTSRAISMQPIRSDTQAIRKEHARNTHTRDVADMMCC